MKEIKRILYVMTHTPRIFWKKFQGCALFKYVPDKTALEIIYKNVFNEPLDLKNPITFNQKLQWLKLYDRRIEYTTMVDKYESKKYMASLIGAEHIVPTYGVWTCFDNIDFTKLPDKFVLKTTHGSGDVVICKDKSLFDLVQARAKLTKALNTNFYRISREWPYKYVKPRIIAEKYMEDPNSTQIPDYKLFCFNGKVKIFKIDFDRFTDHRANYYDLDQQLLSIGETVCRPDFQRKLTIPMELNDMVQIAERIAKDIPFLRVDLYVVAHVIYFGEATFFPAGGCGIFTDKKWDIILGKYIQLP